MSTDWKALCAELLQSWDSAPEFDLSGVDQAMDRARAALAQPEPVGPTDEASRLAKLVALSRVNPPLDEDDIKDAEAAILAVADWLDQQEEDEGVIGSCATRWLREAIDPRQPAPDAPAP